MDLLSIESKRLFLISIRPNLISWHHLSDKAVTHK